MAYNSNFHNNYTFHRPPNFCIPPPPPPQHNFFMQQKPSISDQEFVKKFEADFFMQQKPSISDQEFVKKFEAAEIKNAKSQGTPNIYRIREQMRNIVLQINELNAKEKYLQENISSMSEEEWKTSMDEFTRNKVLLDGLMIFNDTYLEMIKGALTKRSAKRLRLKRARLEKKKIKQEQHREWAEKSRKIDENLLKIKDVIDKAEKDQADKRQTDSILREVTRKKHDAQKSLAKLEALVKLRRARENTARGSGVAVLEKGADGFNLEITRLQTLWTHRLSAYESEESELRARVQADADAASMLAEADQTSSVRCVKKWRRFLFGSSTAQPQRDFGGDMKGFIAARSQWDNYISSEGSTLPIGWVLPST